MLFIIKYCLTWREFANWPQKKVVKAMGELIYPQSHIMIQVQKSYLPIKSKTWVHCLHWLVKNFDVLAGRQAAVALTGISWPGVSHAQLWREYVK